MLPPPQTVLLTGADIPFFCFDINQNCLTRSLNDYVYKTWLNATTVKAAASASSLANLDSLRSGIVGAHSLGLEQAMGLAVGGQSIFITPQDPIYWSAYAMIDRIYTSWQVLHPNLANSTFKTKTANNAPPSRNVTLNSVLPNLGYLDPGPRKVGELIDTMSGALCYEYDNLIG